MAAKKAGGSGGSSAGSASGGSGAKRNRAPAVDRAKHKYAVWAGSSNTPKFWLSDLKELDGVLSGLKPSRLSKVTVGELRGVSTKVMAVVAGA